MPFQPTSPDRVPRIFKYSCGHLDRGILTAKVQGPRLEQILDIQEQGDRLVLWATVDVAQMGYQHTIQIYSAYTGDPPAGKSWSYFKTIQSESDGLVYHLYIKNDW